MYIPSNGGNRLFSWSYTMLEFAEKVLKEIRKLRDGTESLLLSGSVPDMERYRFLMGRLEAIKLMESSIKYLLNDYERTE
jgi:hypothetical protein